MLSSQWLALSAVLMLSLACLVTSVEDEQDDNLSKLRKKRQTFGVLQVIRFQNDACDATGSRNGTCYTEAECEDRGGTEGGSCADGFGVCCVFDIGCGGSSSENCTYFEDSNIGDGSCRAEICPAGNNICQVRLDFDTFVITGPSTLTTSNYKVSPELITVAGTQGTVDDVGLASNCLVDTFSVSSNTGTGPPTICGTNTGEHMYLDSDENCNELVFNFGTGTSSTRSFRIKATQFACDSPILAPQGCTQYFYGNGGTGTAKNYNFDGGYHLANQRQRQCFRREQGTCRICWSHENVDWDISGLNAPATKAAFAQDTNRCCRYTGTGHHGDCVQIFGRLNQNGKPQKPRQCGRNGNNGGTTAGQTRCSSSLPYQVRFNTDESETAGTANDEADGPNQGYKFTYFQDTINCYSDQ